jgi:hypothetical protein
MKLAAVSTPVVRQAPASQAAVAKETEVPKDSFLDKVSKFNEGPTTPSGVAMRTIQGAVFGAIGGHVISGNKARSIGLNAALGAAIGGGGLGVGGLIVGALSGDKALKYGGTGLLVGGLTGGVLGAGVGYADNWLNSALPWTPAINGAVIGGGFALIGGIYSLATQKKPEQQPAA